MTPSFGAIDRNAIWSGGRFGRKFVGACDRLGREPLESPARFRHDFSPVREAWLPFARARSPDFTRPRLEYAAEAVRSDSAVSLPEADSLEHTVDGSITQKPFPVVECTVRSDLRRREQVTEPIAA
jgi:hypothetical protein